MWFQVGFGFGFGFDFSIFFFLFFVFRFRYQFGHLLWAMARPLGGELSSVQWLPPCLRKCNVATFRGISVVIENYRTKIEAGNRFESESDWQLKSSAAFGRN